MKMHRTSHAVWQCQYHLVWSTKYRKRALRLDNMRLFCKEALRRISEQYDMNLLDIEVDEDHVHLNIEIPPQRSVGEAVKILKSLSARMMFKQYPLLKKKLWAGNLWESSYFVRSIGEGVTAEMVKRYIEKHSETAQNSAQQKLFPLGKSEGKR